VAKTPLFGPANPARLHQTFHAIPAMPGIPHPGDCARDRETDSAKPIDHALASEFDKPVT